MKLINNISMRIVIPLFLFILISLLAIYSTHTDYEKSNRNLMKSSSNNIKNNLILMQSALNSLLLNKNKGSVRSLISNLGSNYNYKKVLLFDNNGIVIFSNINKYMGNSFKKITTDTSATVFKNIQNNMMIKIFISKDKKYIIGLCPITFSGYPKITGILYLQYDLDEIQTINHCFFKKIIIDRILEYFFLFLILSLVFYFLITKRANKIIYAINNFSKGKKDAHSNVIGSDELGKISYNFNIMTATISKNNETIKSQSEKLSKNLIDIANILANVVEYKDQYTAGHSRNVAYLACEIAKNMKLDDERIMNLNIAGLLHDIGKISVPIEILSKPEKLTKDEYEIIKTHSLTGYNLIRPIEFHPSIARSILEHHERIDGSGYPNGKKGNDLLLESKILAVADAVEAMSLDRPYRDALGIEAALDEVSKKKGILFDKEVVNACINLFKEKDIKFYFKKK
jgi:putative nucleotidyltransferase with HDIG domain